MLSRAGGVMVMVVVGMPRSPARTPMSNLDHFVRQ